MTRRIIAALAAILFLTSQVLASDWLINSYRFAVAALPAMSFLQCTNNTSDLTTYTFASFNTGTAAADRSLVFTIGSRDSAGTYSISGVTVDGNAAAELIDTAFTTDTNGGIYAINWPTGTTASVAVTFSEQVATASLCAWRITGLSSLTPVDTASVNNGTAGTAINLNSDVSANGVAVAICASGATSGNSYTWVALTERSDVEVSPGGTGSLRQAVADYTEDATASTPLTMSCDPAASGDPNFGAVATFR